MKEIVSISECFAIEGDLVEDFGNRFRFFGISTCSKSGFWPWSKRVDVWKYRFYATVEGECYDFVSGRYFANTSLAFKEFLQTHIQTQNEEKYVSLMERSRKI